MLLCFVPASAYSQSTGLNDEQTEAEKAVFDCFYKSGRQLDDHRSDAGTVAQAMESACSSEIQRLNDVFPGSSEQLDPIIRAEAIRMVLSLRATAEGHSN